MAECTLILPENSHKKFQQNDNYLCCLQLIIQFNPCSFNKRCHWWYYCGGIQNKHKLFSEKGFKPVFRIMDNVPSKYFKNYLVKEDINLQLVEPHNHRADASEESIQTFKKHFISGLCIGDPKFLTVLWSYFVHQSQDPLNILCTSRLYPNTFTYPVLEGVHNFNRLTWEPPKKKRNHIKSLRY